MEPETHARMSELDQRHWWFVARRDILRAQLRTLPLPPGACILDAGCGTGGNLPMLAEFGRVEAFEMNDSARETACRRSGIAVRPGRLPDGVDFAPESFDLITALDVIEHVENDISGLGALRALLRPGGHLLVTVPAYSWLWSAHDERHHHHRRYTRGALRQVVSDAGFALCRATYFNTLLFPLAATVRLVNAATGALANVDDAVPPPPVNAILRAAFAAEGRLLRHLSLPFGLSILCIARREE